jgi:Domain of unknown function (DUF1707)/Cell wall-active antibiotics response 4TMS YvqF
VDPDLPDRPAQMRASHADRERVAEILRTAAGDGRLDIDELQQRLEQVYAAKTYGELEPIVRDLPTGTMPAVRQVQPVARDRIGGTPAGTTAIAIFGGAERKGHWVVPSRFSALAMFGGVDLDLREAKFETATVEITAVAICGGIDIKVPDDVVVQVEGAGVFGGFGRPGDAPQPGPGAPVVRVNGVAIFGGVDVKYPGSNGRKRLEGGG